MANVADLFLRVYSTLHKYGRLGLGWCWFWFAFRVSIIVFIRSGGVVDRGLWTVGY